LSTTFTEIMVLLLRIPFIYKAKMMQA